MAWIGGLLENGSHPRHLVTFLSTEGARNKPVHEKRRTEKLGARHEVALAGSIKASLVRFWPARAMPDRNNFHHVGEFVGAIEDQVRQAWHGIAAQTFPYSRASLRVHDQKLEGSRKLRLDLPRGLRTASVKVSGDAAEVIIRTGGKPKLQG